MNELFTQDGGQKPHIKLDFVNGVLHQRLIFVSSPSELPLDSEDCIIFNDGSKSNGCNLPVYKKYVSIKLIICIYIFTFDFW